jgi:glycosyltransferase involved in cell wall biosynthesis
MAEYWRRSFVNDFEVHPSRVVNIGCGVNIEVPPIVEKDYSRKHVVFIGIDFSRKGGDNLVKAFQSLLTRHPDATLHIVGPRKVPSVLSGSGLNNIEFAGYLSREDPQQRAKLLTILQNGTLLMLPSLYEPFGVGVLEGMLYRMPVIATNGWSFPDFVTRETGLTLDRPDDIQEMADKMDVFLSDPSRSERAGNCGRELVTGHYTWNHVVSRLYQEILPN